MARQTDALLAALLPGPGNFRLVIASPGDDLERLARDFLRAPPQHVLLVNLSGEPMPEGFDKPPGQRERTTAP